MRKKTNKSPKLREFKCILCKKNFKNYLAPSEILNGAGKYCSIKCKSIANGLNKRVGSYKKCRNCNRKFWVSKSISKRGHGKYCSRKCYLPTEKGKAISIDGYYVINSIKVHRTLIEQHIGRKLLSTEIVHHINCDKFDNRIENLQIVTRSEHNKIHKEIRNEEKK